MKLIRSFFPGAFCLAALLSVFSVAGIPKLRENDDEKSFEEFSGENPLEIDDEDENLRSKTTDCRISVNLKLKHFWSENFFAQNFAQNNSKILDDALTKYSTELLTKIIKSVKNEIKITELQIEPLVAPNQLFIKLTASCRSEPIEARIEKSECQSIARGLKNNFNVRGLSRYLIDIGFLQNVNEGEKKLINNIAVTELFPQEFRDGFYFINRLGETAGEEREVSRESLTC